MTDCVILMNERLGSLTLNSLRLTQHKSSSPICVRVLNILGSVEKVYFVSSILVTEHLIVLVHDILDGGLLRVLVDDYRYHDSETVFSEYGNTLKSTMSLRRRNCAPGAVVSIGSTTVVMMTQVYCSQIGKGKKTPSFYGEGDTQPKLGLHRKNLPSSADFYHLQLPQIKSELFETHVIRSAVMWTTSTYPPSSTRSHPTVVVNPFLSHSSPHSFINF